jgi:biopolymer transport protein ExbD
MMVETDLPQVVKEAIAQNKKDEAPTQSVSLEILNSGIVKIKIDNQGKSKIDEVPAKALGEVDFKTLHLHLRAVKSDVPQVFRLEVRPDTKVNYDSIVKVMDEARKSRDPQVKFPVMDKEKGTTVQTDYMFPDVVFGNVLEG